MWQGALLETIARLSAVDATLATFTAAGDVRRELANHGFKVEKIPGFGRKREMIRASFSTMPEISVSSPSRKRSSAQHLPWSILPPNQYEYRSALIIGAGLAGAHSAFALAQRGWKVTVLEKEKDVANAASGNAQGILYAGLSADDSYLGRYNLFSLGFAQRAYRECWDKSEAGEQCGVLYLAQSETEEAALKRLCELWREETDFVRWLLPAEASTLANVPIAHPAMWVVQTGWLQPRSVCERLLAHDNMTLKHREVKNLRSTTATSSRLGQNNSVIAEAPGLHSCQCLRLHIPLMRPGG